MSKDQFWREWFDLMVNGIYLVDFETYYYRCESAEMELIGSW